MPSAPRGPNLPSFLIVLGVASVLLVASFFTWPSLRIAVDKVRLRRGEKLADTFAERGWFDRDQSALRLASKIGFATVPSSLPQNHPDATVELLGELAKATPGRWLLLLGPLCYPTLLLQGVALAGAGFLSIRSSNATLPNILLLGAVGLELLGLVLIAFVYRFLWKWQVD